MLGGLHSTLYRRELDYNEERDFRPSHAEPKGNRAQDSLGEELEVPLNAQPGVVHPVHGTTWSGSSSSWHFVFMLMTSICLY